jgi:hypothetical protein
MGNTNHTPYAALRADALMIRTTLVIVYRPR